jgi:hypothetical protein
MEIVVVGGGTAGWISALLISSIFKDIHNVTVVESSDIKSIGVGEGSTGFLRGIVNNEVWNLNCNEYDFMKYTKATPKLGIFFKDWQSIDQKYVEPIDNPIHNSFLFSDPLLLNAVANDLPIHIASLTGNFLERGLVPFTYLDNDSDLPVGQRLHAYHFDAKLAAEYFENICSDKVKKINAKILDIEFFDNGFVKNLTLENQEKVFGDFFIDASGFSRIFAKKMNVEFIEFKEISLNSAIPFKIEKNNVLDKNFYTTAWAQKHGWVWMIPKQDYIGCGYIYDDSYTDEEGAKNEIEKKFNQKIEIIKKISFKSGMQKTVWNKNVLSIGLSSHFLEPLEATSIHGTIAQLHNFIFMYLKNNKEDTIIESSINKYNKETSSMIENFKNFILLHYGKNRSDTDFWKKMNNSVKDNNFLKEIICISESRVLNSYDLSVAYGAAEPFLFNWTLAALGYFNKEMAKRELSKPGRIKMLEQEFKNIDKYFTNYDWLTNKDFLFLLQGKKHE